MYADDPIRLKRWGLEGKTKEEIIELGDQHPAFRYVVVIFRRCETDRSLGICYENYITLIFQVDLNTTLVMHFHV